MNRREMKAIAIQQDNWTGGFNSRANDQNGSNHNRRAKRHANKRLRQHFKKELEKLQ